MLLFSGNLEVCHDDLILEAGANNPTGGNATVICKQETHGADLIPSIGRADCWRNDMRVHASPSALSVNGNMSLGPSLVQRWLVTSQPADVTTWH